MADEVVLDASVIAKLVVEEPGSASARGIVAESRLTCLAPGHAMAEVFEVICRKSRGADDLRQRLRLSRLWLQSAIVSLPIDALLDSAIELTVDTGASVYDSLYVALAEERGVDLVTADDRLIRRFASHPLGLRLIPLVDAERWMSATFPRPSS